MKLWHLQAPRSQSCKFLPPNLEICLLASTTTILNVVIMRQLSDTIMNNCCFVQNTSERKCNPCSGKFHIILVRCWSSAISWVFCNERKHGLGQRKDKAESCSSNSIYWGTMIKILGLPTTDQQSPRTVWKSKWRLELRLKLRMRKLAELQWSCMYVKERKETRVNIVWSMCRRKWMPGVGKTRHIRHTTDSAFQI